MKIVRRMGTTPAERGSTGANNCPDVLRLDNGDYVVIGKLPEVPATLVPELVRNGASVGTDEQYVIVPAACMHAAAQDMVKSQLV